MRWTWFNLVNKCVRSQSLHRGFRSSSLLYNWRRTLSSGPVSPPPLHRRLLLYLTQRFYDVEKLVTWTSRLKRNAIQKKNAWETPPSKRLPCKFPHCGINIKFFFFFFFLNPPHLLLCTVVMVPVFVTQYITGFPVFIFQLLQLHWAILWTKHSSSILRLEYAGAVQVSDSPQNFVCPTAFRLYFNLTLGLIVYERISLYYLS